MHDFLAIVSFFAVTVCAMSAGVVCMVYMLMYTASNRAVHVHNCFNAFFAALVLGAVSCLLWQV